MIMAIEDRLAVAGLQEKVRQVRHMLPPFSEVCWFLTSLVLFMVLGPFAAPVALFAIFRLDSDQCGLVEPESAE